MINLKYSPIFDGFRLSCLSVSLGLAVAASAAHAQIDEVTGLPARAIRSVEYRTIDNGKVLFVIEYYYDHIGKSALTAAAPRICERLGITFDRVKFPPDSNDQGDLFNARARVFEVRCR